MPELDLHCFLPSTNDLIGQHQLHLERRLSEVLFKAESPVFIECGQGIDHIQAVIKSIVGSIAFVQFCDEKSLEEVKLDQLVIGISPYPSSVYSFDNLFSLRNLDGNQLMKPINSYIQSGHFFELIDQYNPRIVRTVKIIENQNGFVRAIDANDKEHSVLLSSGRCRRIGWSMLQKNEGHFQLEPFLGATVKNIVPWFMFDRVQLREHNVEIGQVFEVIDPVSRYRIIPGVVTEIFNKYYFRVSLIYSHHDQDLPFLVCHRGSPDLLPANFCSRSGLRLSVPEGVDESSFNIYKVRGKHATDYMLDIPKNVERFDTNRKIEIYDEQKEHMLPATILRQHRHLLVVRLEHQKEFLPPRLYAYYDERLFNVGAAQSYGLKLASVPTLIDRQAWKYELDYKIVTKPNEHDPRNGRRFMAKVFADARQFVPPLYINFDCYKGPFINEETARFIDTKIASSHFQPVMRHIIHSVLENVIKFEYQRFAAAQAQSQAPTYTVKLTNPKSDKRSRTLQIEVCENANQFPGWLRQFLLRLEICPNFIAPTKRKSGEPCPQGCHLIKQLYPFMLPGKHIHCPINLSKLEEQRAKRQNLGIAGQTTSTGSRRPRDGAVQSGGENSDLNEPLSTRRGRRAIKATNRHEILMDEPPAWRRRQLTGQALSTLVTGVPLQQRRKRTLSNAEYNQDSNTTNSALSSLLMKTGRGANSQNLPPQRPKTARDYLLEMNDRIDETVRSNLNSWGSQSRNRSCSTSGAYLPDMNGQRHHEVFKAAAVRKFNGPRVLYPQQAEQQMNRIAANPLNALNLVAANFPSLGHGSSNGSFGDQELPPRLQPAQKIDEDSDRSENDDMFIDDDMLEAPKLLPIKPEVSIKTQPQIQEYLKRVQEKQQISPNDEPSTSSSVNQPPAKLPPVQLEKAGEYDTEITPPKLSKSSDTVDLLRKYDLKDDENPAEWQNKRLVEFMRRQNFNEVADFLEKEEFDGQSFFLIRDEEIKDMGLKRGPELNLKRLLKELKEISENAAK